MRLTKIYTRTGDEGYTNLRDSCVSKDDLLVEALGTIDELNSSIGLVLAYCQNKEIHTALTRIQHDLFDMGGELHLPQYVAITSEKVSQLEQQIDAWNKTLAPLKEFVLPRGDAATAACHLARTICRRAERALVRLHRQVRLTNMEMLRYLNRLSDVLFVCARILARNSQAEEILWEHEKHK